MTKELAKISHIGKSAWNIVKSVGPFIIAQSGKASEAYAKYKERMTSIDIAKQVIIDETEKMNDVKKQLLQKYIESDPVNRLKIIEDIEYLNARIRQFSVHEKALSYLSESEKEEVKKSPKEISPHWMDKFNELARLRNEKWREELLARALAAEALNSGSVTPRALWLIGTLEERLFTAFAGILDICSKIGEYFIIPKMLSEIGERPISGSPFGAKTVVGNLVYMVDEVGLIADVSKAVVMFSKDSKFIAGYLGNRYVITCAEDLQIRGIMPTGIGDSIASFYEQKHSKLGEDIFKGWIDGLNKEKFKVSEVPAVTPGADPGETFFLPNL